MAKRGRKDDRGSKNVPEELVALYESEDPKEYEEYLKKYEENTKRTRSKTQKGVTYHLNELATFVDNQIREAVASRDPQHLTKDEIYKIFLYKMLRGTWRPMLFKFMDQLDEDDVKKQTTEAFVTLHQKDMDMERLKHVMQPLLVLKGVGPALASVVLSIVSPEFFPAVVESVLDVKYDKVKYDMKMYTDYAQTLRNKADVLSSSDSKKWTAEEVGRALWSAGVEYNPGLEDPSIVAGSSKETSSQAKSGSRKRSKKS